MEKKRLNWIDIAKGICMIAVVLGHLGVEKLGFVYSFHLTGFFILSGFTMKKTQLTAGYLKNKFGRLMAPYFTTCFFVTAAEAATLILKREFTHFTFTQLIYNNLLRTFFASGTFENMGDTYLGRNIGAIWFLPAMFFAILFTQLVLNITDNKKLQVGLSVGIAAIGCISAKAVWLPFSIQSAMLSVPFILSGIFAREYDILSKIKPLHYAGLFVIFIAGCLTGKAQIFYIVVCAVGDWFITPICAFASAFLVIGLSKKVANFKPLEYIGKNSMIYLCVHLFEMSALAPFYNKLFEILPIPDNTVTRFIIEFAAINVISIIIITFNGRKKKEQKSLKVHSQRDLSVDFARCVFLILLLVGRLVFDPQFNLLNINIDILLLAIISGYCFDKNKPLKAKLLNCPQTLVPYLIFATVYVVLVPNKNPTSIFSWLTNGLSYGESPATAIAVVLPAVYILYLFITKLIYAFLSQIKSNNLLHIICIALGLIGFALSEYSPKLTVRLDYILIEIMVFHIASEISRLKLLEKAKDIPFIYFPLAWVCCVALLNEKADISQKITVDFGFTVFSLFCAFTLVYLLSTYINSRLPRVLNCLISLLGKSIGYVLVIVSLLHTFITYFATDKLNLYHMNIFYLVFVIAIEITGGIAFYCILNIARRIIFKKVIK